jgi:hypothetical protein
VGAWSVASAAGFVLAAAAADRYPLSVWLVLIGIVVPSFALGFVLDGFLWFLVGVVYLPIVLVAAAVVSAPILILATPLAVGAAMLAIPAGVGARRIARNANRAWLVASAGAAIAIALIAPAVAWVEKHRTVRVHGPRPLLVDERRGAVGGLALGDPPARVKAALGEPPASDPNRGVGALDTTDFGPDYLPNLRDEQDLAYRKLFFAANARRVRYLEVVDRRAHLSRGVGPGDSISLLRRAYPRLACDEGDAGSDEPIPFPRCHGWTAPRVYLYVAGDYSKPGTPITEIWLADFDLVRGGRAPGP